MQWFVWEGFLGIFCGFGVVFFFNKGFFPSHLQSNRLEKSQFADASQL